MFLIEGVAEGGQGVSGRFEIADRSIRFRQKDHVKCITALIICRKKSGGKMEFYTYFCSLSQYHRVYCSMYLRGAPQVGHVCVAIAGGGGGGGLDIRDMSKMVGIANGLCSRYPAKYPPSM